MGQNNNQPPTYHRSRKPRQRPKPSSDSSGSISFTPLVLLFILVIAAVVILLLSSRSLPGERLYPVKRYSEQIRLMLTNVAGERLELEKTFDRERHSEVKALTEQSRSESVSFTGALSETNSSGERIVGEVPVQFLEDTQVIGDLNLSVWVRVDGTTRSDGTVIADSIRPRVYEITATLHSVASNQWLIDGVTITVMPDTLIRGSPMLGSEIMVKAQMLADERLIATYIEEMAEP